MQIQKNDRYACSTTARRLIISIFLALLLAKQGAAGGRDPNILIINLDPAKTTIHWTLKDVLHTVHGTFKLQRGFIHIDTDTGRAEGLVDVDARSGESSNSARDAVMHKQILESNKYPFIRFRPEQAFGKFNSNSPQVITMNGQFELHGQDHAMQMQIVVRPNGNGYITTTHFTVPYVAWGLKDPSNFLLHVSHEVDIEVETTTELQH
jgi:polyisoprenoid-binding protein YceI